MPMPSDAPALAASFTLGCLLIHACRREAAALTAFLVLILAAVSLLLVVLLVDRAGGDRVSTAEIGETSERTYGFE